MASPANSILLPDSDYGAATGDLGSLGEEDGDYQGPHNWRQRLKPVKSRSRDTEDEGEDEEEPPIVPKESVVKDGKKMTTKEDRPDGGRIRERLKLMPAWKKDLLEKKKSRPMSTRHSNGSAASVAPSQIPLSISSGLKRRNTNPGAESAFTQQVVNSQPILSGVPRKRVSPSSSFRQPNTGQPGRRNPSNPLVDPTSNSELTKKRIERVQRARLYLLQQTGPNSFLIGGDSPDHKFRVIIGPQTCSCGRGPHCVHVLFVMLRVFQVRHNDNCLWSKTLKNYEVENLFRIYHDKRTSRIQRRQLEREKKKEAAQQEQDSEQTSGSAESTSLPSESDTGSMREEEDTCPICLLEMLEGESLLKCENGCHNRLHHHCIAIWFEECRRQNEPLICPLCRAQWKTMTVEIKTTRADTDLPEAPPNTRAPSPQTVQESEMRLPHAEPIPRDYLPTAEPWIQVLGEELVSCLFSRNWSIRETGVKHLSKEVIATLLRGMGEGRSGIVISPDRQQTTSQMLDTCTKILAFMCGDPVYRVFVASLRAMRTMLSYTPCRDKQQQQRLQSLLKPIVDAIVFKCTDGNKRTSQLSVSTLIELAKGQGGELAVGKEIVNPGSKGLDGLNYVLKCVTEQYQVEQVQWQWLLGRLYIIDKLMDEFPQDFLPREIEGAADAASGDPVPDEAGASAADTDRQPVHTERLLSVARFSVKAVCNAHVRIAKMARRVFLLTAKLGAHLQSIVGELENLLSNIDSSSVISVKRKLARIINDFQLSEKIVQELQHGSKKDYHADVESPTGSPTDSPISTPRCPSPATVYSETHSEAGGKSVPCCPPNTPTHSSRNKKKRRSIPRRITKDSVLLAKSQHEKLVTETETETSAQDSNSNTFVKPDMVPLICVTSSTNTSNPQSSQEKADVDDSVFVHQDSSSNSVADFEEQISLCDEEGHAHGGSGHRSVPLCCDVLDDKSNTDVEAIPAGSAAAPNTPEHGSHFHTAEQETMSSDDLLDLHGSSSSPGTPSDHPVSFKSEVAESPKTSPSHTVDHDLASQSSEKCSCKEEVEKEEAEALAQAMAISERQDPTPVVPGLTPTSREEVITIRIQPEDGGETSSDHPSVYYENIHWVKGPLLGTGAYSTCYQARDVRTGVLMAVKQISFCRNSPVEQDRVIEAISEEVHMMARLNHPNVVRIFGATKQGCHFNMFVEWMSGGSLTYLLGRYGSFSDEVITSYTRQILQGLAYLHDNGILHRDLKGANLLVDSTGQRLRIGDFGAAARLASRETGAGEFQGQLLGTIAFMAPEVLRGENYGRACDVWSIGCCMIEMATTRPPWNAPDISNHLALIFKIASSIESPPIPENLSPPVRDLMLRCLEQESEFRPTAKELLMHPLFTQYHKRAGYS